jgi:hypothetical protein
LIDSYLTDYVPHRVIYKDVTVTPVTGDNYSTTTPNNPRSKSDVRASKYNKKRLGSRNSKDPSKLSNYSVTIAKLTLILAFR